MSEFDYDVVVIGSGFGGSVSALRLTEKGYRVGVLESGRRWDAESLPRSNWNLRKSIWAPELGCTGPPADQCARHLRGVLRRRGGWRLPHLRQHPLRTADRLLHRPAGAHITDWRDELAPYYDQARRMLGVATNPRTTPAGEVIREVAGDMGVGETFHPTEVGVFFNEDDPGAEVTDPYFGGGAFRFLPFLLAAARHPVVFLRSFDARRASERSVILLVMQSLDNSLTSFLRRGKLKTGPGTGEPNPTWIPLAHEVGRRFAAKIGATPTASTPMSWTSRPRRTTSAAVSSATARKRVWWTPISGCTGIPVCTSPTGPRSRPTWGSTPR